MANELEETPSNSENGMNDPGEPQALAPPAAPEFDLLGEESQRLAAYWKDQIKQVDDDQQRFLKRGRMIERRYRDERARADEEAVKRYASLWSNVEILYPAIYGRQPVPVAERRFRDRDPAGRGAAQMLERGLRNEIEINGFGEAVGQAVLDYLLPGRGTVWVRYEPEFAESMSLAPEAELDMRDARGEIEPYDDSESEEKLHQTGDRVIRESIPVDYVNWADFRAYPAKARVWRETSAVSKDVCMSRGQMIRRFGEKTGKAIPLQHDDPDRRGQIGRPHTDNGEDDKGRITEIWDRNTESVLWVAEGYEFLCDKVDDPLRLENFYPCPRPLFANATNSTLVPVADYIQYQDQALQIDDLTQRLAMLCKACKVAGLYNAASKDIMRLLDESIENELVPVDNWAAFAEKGGVAGQMSLLPLKEIIGVINELQIQLEKVMATMDRLTGITDVMRGTGDARETMGGQRLKSNSSGTRLSRRQNEVARFCRDTVRIMADIMASHYSPQSLIEVSGALLEEGLGAADMPPMSALTGAQPMPGAPQPGGPPPMPAPPMLGHNGPPPGPMPGQAPAPGAVSTPPQAPPAMPSGPSNVVPFPAPPGVSPPAGPPVPSPMGAGGQMAIPPEVQAKFEALQRIANAIRLLRDERLRGFRVDIEVDTTIYGDAAQEKADRVEFITATTKFLQMAMPMGAQAPEMVPLLGKLLQFGTRGFKVGRDLESAIEDFVDQAEQAVKKKQGMPPPPNPLLLKQQADAKKAETDAQTAQMRAQVDGQKSQMGLQVAQVNAQADQARAAAEVQRQQVEAASEQANTQGDLQQAQADLEMRKMEMQIEHTRLQIELAKLQGQAAQQAHERAMPPPNPPQQGAGGL